MEIIVDCYGEEERAMGWYYHLQDKLTFPFLARMAPEEECEREVFVVMRWEREGLAVPLSQLEIIHADDDGETEQAACDWLYWSTKGYRF